MELAELRPHLHSLPDRPDWIPYKTSYYRESWGFCAPHNVVKSLRPGQYEVCIDSSLTEGSMTYGECRLPGSTTEEVLVYTHACHPSLANDNLSGIAVATFLARWLKEQARRFTYRIVFAPGLIGALAWLAHNRRGLSRVRHGLVLSGVGDAGHLTYKKSRRGNAEIDRVVDHVLRLRGTPHEIREFTPYGYDERQFCAPGFNLPMGCLMRTPFDEYPEYHTSADNPGFVQPSSLADTLEVCQEIVAAVETNVAYRNLRPYGEPQLGKRGLYTSIHHRDPSQPDPMAILWMLNLSDGTHDVLDIAEQSGCDVTKLVEAGRALVKARLLKAVDGKRR
jgi:aminopeptidase-like protein